MLSKEETEHIAKLARLGLSAQEIEKYQKDLSSILGYIDQLKEVDIANVKPFTHAVDISNVSRVDVAVKKTKEETDKLIKEMPDTKGRYLKVKSVF
jgi:aspartyl-tRNA(Asn)/glutamyl-tRNA(Gln) amidotransferase subunit C